MTPPLSKDPESPAPLRVEELALLGGEDFAVDSSFFKADASKAGIYTETKLNKQRMAQNPQRMKQHCATG